MHILPVVSQSLKARCGNPMATTVNLSLSRAAGTAERPSRDIPLLFPSSQTSSRPRTISGVSAAVPFFAYVKEKLGEKKSFMDIWTCTREVSFVSVHAGTSGFNGTDPNLYPFPINTIPCGFPIITLLISECMMLAVCCLAHGISFCRWVNNRLYL